MSHSELSRRISTANEQLERALKALIALDPGPDYVEPLASAAALLSGISIENLTPAERAWLLEQAPLLSSRVGQAETLFHSAGTLRLGGLLDNSRATSGYTVDGTPDCAANGAFHIEG